MDIKKLLGLGNIDAKKTENAENKGKNLPFANDYSEMSEKSYSKHSKASRAAAIALMAATLGAGAPMMTSCVEQEQFVQNDNSELVAALMQMIAMQQQQIDNLNAILSQLKDDNASIKSLLMSISNQNAQIISVLQSIKQDTGDIVGAIYQLVTMAKIANQNDEEFKAKLDKIIAGQGSNEEKLQAIIDAINTQNETLLSIADLINIVNNNVITVGENVNAVGDKLSGAIEKLYQQYKAGYMSMTQLMTAIFNEIKSSNLVEQSNDEEFKELLLQIINGQGDNGDKLDKVLDAIKTQSQIISDIESLISTFGQNILSMGQEISGKLDNLYKQYQEGNITMSELLTSIFNEIKNSNSIQQSNDEEFKNLLNRIINGQDSNGEKLDNITNAINAQSTILANIEKLINSLEEKLGAVGKDISNKLTALYMEYKAGNITQAVLLHNIYSELKKSNKLSSEQNNKLDQIYQAIQNADTSNAEGLAQVAEAMNQMLDMLNIISQQIDQVMSQLMSINDNLTDQLKEIKDLKSQIKKFYSAWKTGSITTTQMMAQILTQIGKLNSNNEEAINLLMAIENAVNSGNASTGDILTEILNKLDHMGGSDPEVLSALQDIRNAVQAGNISNDEANKRIANILKMILGSSNTGNFLSAQILDKISDIEAAIISGAMSEEEALSAIATLLQQVKNNTDTMIEQLNVVVDQLMSVNSNLKDQTKELKEVKSQIQKFYNSWKAGNITTNSMMAQILTQLGKLSCNDKDVINLLKAIEGSITEGNATTADLLTQVLDKLNNMGGTDPEVLKALKEIKNAVQAGNMSNDQANKEITKLLKKILGSSNTGNYLSAQILAKMADIEAAVMTGALSEEEALAAITDLLNQIKTNTDTIINKLGTISSQIAGLDSKLDANHNSNVNLLKDILLHTANMDGKMDVVIKNQKEANKQLVNISGKSDEIIAQLKLLNGNVVKKSDLKNLLGDFYNEIKPYLDNNASQMDVAIQLLKDIKNKQGNSISKADLQEVLGDLFERLRPLLEDKNQIDLSEVIAAIQDLKNNIGSGEIDLSDVIAAIEANRVDLTKTNALIETLTNVVQNLDFKGKDYASQLQTIINLLGSIQSQGGADSSKFQDLLQEVLNKLTSIDQNGAAGLDVMNAILDVARQIKANQDQFMGDANKFGIKLFEELAKIKDGVGNINTLIAYAESYQEALAKAEQSRQQQIALLQALVDKEITVNGGSGDGITINQLRELMKELQIPDYTDILNEIKDKIGSVVTSADLQNFFLKTQPDLTKTNALIETLTNVVQNINVGGSGGSADMSRVETLLGQIIDTLNGQNNPTQSQIQDLINALNQLVQNTTPTSPSNAKRRAINPRLYAAYNEAVQKADPKTYVPVELYLGAHISGDDVYHA